MRRVLYLFLSLALLAAPAWADEISDQLEKALKLYKAGQLNEALTEVDFAAAQMRQKKAEGLAVVFPPAPAGWRAEEVATQSLGGGLLGGVGASREYRPESGEGSAKIEIVSDSPMIQAFGMFLTNPAMVQSDKKAKLVRVGEEKAILKQENPQTAELNFLVNNKVLVKVEAEGLANPAQVVQDLAAKINLAKLKELVK